MKFRGTGMGDLLVGDLTSTRRKVGKAVGGHKDAASNHQ